MPKKIDEDLKVRGLCAWSMTTRASTPRSRPRQRFLSSSSGSATSAWEAGVRTAGDAFRAAARSPSKVSRSRRPCCSASTSRSP